MRHSNEQTSASTSTASGTGKAKWVALALVGMVLAVSNAAHAQAYVNVTIGGAFAPGVYGQIAIGNNPPPPVINAQPVIVGQPVYGAPPMYLYVAAEEYRDWGRYCWRYQACGRPVHFVRVDERNPWWEHRAEYLRGRAQYREPEYRHDMRNNHDNGRRGDHEDHRGRRYEEFRR